jgi:hypothetical protein
MTDQENGELLGTGLALDQVGIVPATFVRRRGPYPGFGRNAAERIRHDEASLNEMLYQLVACSTMLRPLREK